MVSASTGKYIAKRMYAFGLNLHTDAYIHIFVIEKKKRTTNTKNKIEQVNINAKHLNDFLVNDTS